MEISGLDLTTSAFVGFCVKPQLEWSLLTIIIDSMLTLPLMGTLGIVWALQIKKTLQNSSYSSQTKAMQRRMNNLMMIQEYRSFFLNRFQKTKILRISRIDLLTRSL
ncbi:hypothetical protein COOONC_02848 [Cooperia oncophora]